MDYSKFISGRHQWYGGKCWMSNTPKLTTDGRMPREYIILSKRTTQLLMGGCPNAVGKCGFLFLPNGVGMALLPDDAPLEIAYTIRATSTLSKRAGKQIWTVTLVRPLVNLNMPGRYPVREAWPEESPAQWVAVCRTPKTPDGHVPV